MIIGTNFHWKNIPVALKIWGKKILYKTLLIEYAELIKLGISVSTLKIKVKLSIFVGF